MSNPAPGTLETVRAFVNTRDIEDGIERLSTPARLAAWLVEHGLADGGLEAGAAELRRAVELREALRAQLLAHHGEPAAEEAVATVDAAARRARLRVRFSGPDAVALEPEAEGVDGALGRLLAIVAGAIGDGGASSGNHSATAISTGSRRTGPPGHGASQTVSRSSLPYQNPTAVPSSRHAATSAPSSSHASRAAASQGDSSACVPPPGSCHLRRSPYVWRTKSARPSSSRSRHFTPRVLGRVRSDQTWSTRYAPR